MEKPNSTEVTRLLQIKDNLNLVLLDRDGVINVDSADYIKSADEWHPIEGALEAIVQLQNEYRVAVCSNQSGVDRGYFNEVALAAIHKKMNDGLVSTGGQRIDVYYCPHIPQAQCLCRKPHPQLLELAMDAFGIGPNETLYIGDSEKDLIAARRAGCRAALVLTGSGQKTKQTKTGKGARWVFGDLAAVAARLCAPT